MIKWFDADKFLPGREVGAILIRVAPDDSIAYFVGTYQDMTWWADDLEAITYPVTHWAHINEPFE